MNTKPKYKHKPGTVRVNGELYEVQIYNTFNRRLYSFDGGRTWDITPLYALRGSLETPKKVAA